MVEKNKHVLARRLAIALALAAVLWLPADSAAMESIEQPSRLESHHDSPTGNRASCTSRMHLDTRTDRNVRSTEDAQPSSDQVGQAFLPVRSFKTPSSQFTASSLDTGTEPVTEAAADARPGDSTPEQETGGVSRTDSSTHAPRFTRFWRSPTGALFKSVIVPGGGQWSNGKWQKALIFTAAEGYFLGKALHWRAETWNRLNAYNRSEADADFDSYLDARDGRNRFYWFFGTTVFVAMWDAYTDAHLLTFERTRDKGDEFWGGETADINSEMWRVTLTWRF